MTRSRQLKGFALLVLTFAPILYVFACETAPAFYWLALLYGWMLWHFRAFAPTSVREWSNYVWRKARREGWA